MYLYKQLYLKKYMFFFWKIIILFLVETITSIQHYLSDRFKINHRSILWSYVNNIIQYMSVRNLVFCLLNYIIITLT